MDGQRFDDFARRFGSNASRRRVLQGIVGGAVIAVFGTRASASAEGTCGGVDAVCSTTMDCCAGTTCQADTCQTCQAEGVACDTDQECCAGACELTRHICAACKGQDQACDDSTNCCTGLTCLPANGGDTCQAPTACLANGAECAASGQCCSEFCNPAGGVCTDACGEINADCTSNADCCDTLTCAQGSCLFCRPAGAACSGSGGCCPGASCVDGIGCVADGEGTATVTLHVATCPTGVGPGIFDQCHGNYLADVVFTVDSGGVQPAASAITTIASDGGGVASATVVTGGATVTEDAGTFGAYLGAYVYCSEQKSGVVLFDNDAPGGTVSFAVSAGDDVICDWYNLTAAPAGPTPEPTPPDEGTTTPPDPVATTPATKPDAATTPATTLPSTGIADAAADGNDSWLTTAALGGAAAALIVAKHVRDRTQGVD